MAARILRDVSCSSQAKPTSSWLLFAISLQHPIRLPMSAIPHGVSASAPRGLRLLAGRAGSVFWQGGNVSSPMRSGG